MTDTFNMQRTNTQMVRRGGPGSSGPFFNSLAFPLAVDRPAVAVMDETIE